MNDAEATQDQFEVLEHDVAELQRIVAHQETPSIRPIHFKPTTLHHRDERGPDAAAIGVYNPVAARVYLGLFGAAAGPGAFPVPAKSALILPVTVPGFLEVAIDEGELGQAEATIYLMRFRTPQPFFLGTV